MSGTMVHKSPRPAHHQGFAIFDECRTAVKDQQTTLTAAPDTDVLSELSKGQSQSRTVSVHATATPPTKSPRREGLRLEARSTKCQAVRLTPRAQRPQAHAETFEPLVAVPEESNNVVGTENTAAVSSSTSLKRSGENQTTPLQADEERQVFLAAARNLSLEGQVEKHLAGQFEWIMTYPAGAGPRRAGDGIAEPKGESSSTITVYGCNMLPGRRQQLAHQSSAEPSADMFSLLATTLTKDSCYYPSMAKHDDMLSPVPGHSCQLPPHPHPGTLLQGAKVTTVVEQAVSPSLTAVSERNDSIVSGSSRAASFSAPRIEDSLEELDKLEEELEAVSRVTRPDPAAKERPVQVSPGGSKAKASASKGASASKANKRVSIAGYSATVRVVPSQEKPPTLRRSASLTFQDKKASQPGSSSNNGARGEASQSAANRLSTPRLSVKSSKPLTVAKFELPGDAVARRLKEQREARLAQQAEAQKAQAPSAPKPRSSKPLARPTFELPGEAISRRKREEREAKLRAEEEEARKRREFKARPVRQSIGSATAPRDTLTSRVRQRQSLHEALGDPEMQRKQLPVGPVGNNARIPLASNSPQTRGRGSGTTTILASRATSASTGNGSGKRSSVSFEELAVQQQRGREIVSKDKSFTLERLKEKQEREAKAKMAREEAAERSRMASREWADKKRRNRLAGRQAKENQDNHHEVQT